MAGGKLSRPLQRSDVDDSYKLFDYLKKLEERNTQLEQQLTSTIAAAKSANSQTTQSQAFVLTDSALRQIRDGLSVSGAAPLALDGLPGLPAQNTPTNMLTTDTPQSVLSGAVKTIAALWSFQAGLILGGGTNIKGASAVLTWAYEELTLSTGGTTTDTAATLLPGFSLILGVLGRVSQTITTAATVQIGDATTAARFATLGTMTLGATFVGLGHLFGSVTTDAAGPTQATSAKIRTTANVTPGAGKIELATLALVFTPPTS
jgi:hypothetical protein